MVDIPKRLRFHSSGPAAVFAGQDSVNYWFSRLGTSSDFNIKGAILLKVSGSDVKIM